SVSAAVAPRPMRAALAGVWRGAEAARWIGRALSANRTAITPLEAALRRDGFGPLDGLGELCRAQLQTTSLPMLLHYEDRSSMAHGIEARVPFLDHRLVEFSVALGDHHKMLGGETKRVLRRAMSDLLPAMVRDRTDKIGFATPEESWLKGPLRGFVRD